MITIANTTFTSNISLSAILNVKTKVEMLEICKKLDLYVSPNIKKDETARRLATAILDNPIEVLSRLCKAELQIVEEFVKGGPNTYVTRKARKMEYKLQKYCLVLTHIDEAKGEWHMLMPDSVRESLTDDLPYYLEMANNGIKPPSAKELRMMTMMQRLRNGEL